MKLLRLLSIIFSSALIAGCGGSAPTSTATNAAASSPAVPPGYRALPTAAQPKLPTMKLWLGSDEMIAEIADNDLSRETGMMFRTNMAENEGMLFVFPMPHQTSFWMKNTKVPLSAAYIDPDGMILEIHKLEPENTNSVMASSARVQFVLETPQGWFERHHVPTGAVVKTEQGTLKKVFLNQRSP